VTTCLVVDDNRVIRLVARTILERLGCRVIEAADGSEAVAQFQREMPDVMLLDWSMPVMDGLEVLRRLREEAGGDRVKVIFCSVEADLDFIRKALDRGADEYLIKPFDSEILASKLSLAGVA